MSEGFKFKFKLLRGRHVDANGKYHFKDNPIIFTNQDLRKIDPGGAKFMLLAIGGVQQEPEMLEHKPVEQEELLSPETDNEVVETQEELSEEEQIDSELLETLSGMTLPELKEMASDNDIDLQGATKKADIINVLSEQMASV